MRYVEAHAWPRREPRYGRAVSHPGVFVSEPSSSGGTQAEGARRVYGVHGIRVTVSSEWPEFLALSDLMLGAFPGSAATSESLSVQVDLRIRGWLESPAVPIERQGQEERWGTNEFLEADSARFAAGKLVVRYADGTDAAVRASYILDRSSRFRRLFGGEPPWEDEFALFRLGIQEPLLLKLERRGAVLLHGSAVARDGRAVLLVGLNGSGKSTLCASLLDELDYVSDNFVAVEGKTVLGFPSALRMPGAPPKGSEALPTAHGKTFVRANPTKTRSVAQAHAVVFLSLGTAPSFAELTPSEGFRRFLQIQDMTHEFPRHTYLGPLAPSPNPEALEALSRDVPTYRLVMVRTAEARERVLSLL